MSTNFDSKVEAIFECWRSSLTDTTLLAQMVGGDITNLVKKWYRDTDNYGLLIQSIDKNFIDNDYQAFFSNNNTISGDSPKPLIYITYRNQNGIENYLDYKVQEFTDGQSFINTFNGNMTTMINVGNTIGGHFPVCLNLIYNTNDVILKNETFFGVGYKLNLEQTIKEVIISSVQYLEYMDSDGTLHYFYKSAEGNDIYCDEDGLGLTIKKNINQCIMKTNDNVMSTFKLNNGIYYLTELMDAEGNVITVSIDSNNRINKVTDVYNAEVTIAYYENLITIISPEKTTKLYFIDGKIMTIETVLGHSTISYNSENLISSITDVTGLKLVYEYYSKFPYKMKKVIQYGLNNVLGQYFSLEYGFDTTRIIDNKGKAETIIFNSDGNVLSRNSLKSDEDISGAYSVVQQYDSEFVKNKITSDFIPVAYVKNYLKNTSFESDDISFISDELLTCEISMEYSKYGQRSLKLQSAVENKQITLGIDVPKGKNYTFSGYFKNNCSAIIELKYMDSDGNEIVVDQNIKMTDEFEMSDVTIFYDENASSQLYINIKLLDVGVLYMDNIQLEEGEVANLYNMIENSDFSEGFSDWNCSAGEYDLNDEEINQFFNIVKFNDNKSTALKVSMNPLIGSSFNKKIPIKGKKGDLYTISFWYKNEGVPVFRPHSGNYVVINFIPSDGEGEYCVLESSTFNSNDSIWQYFTYSNYALDDYDEINIAFIQDSQANNFYITNLSLYHNITGGTYSYDENGNLVSIGNNLQENTTLKYDGYNQLISTYSPKGNNFKYEYDNSNCNRVINAISSTGIANEIKYDDNGNPILCRIANKIVQEIVDGEYRIRCKGTKKYLKAELNCVILEENQCSNTLWHFKNVDGGYKISYSIVPSYNIAYIDNSITLSNYIDNALFFFEKNDNGSFYIYLQIGEEKKYLKSNNDSLMLDNLVINNSSYEFYLEKKEDIFIERSSSYSTDGRFMQSFTDSNNNTSSYEYDNSTGLLTSVTLPNNREIAYEYNDKMQIKKQISLQKNISYEYDNKNLVTSVIDGDRTYNFEYDDFLNMKKVKVGNDITLVENEYESGNGNLTKIKFGNNQEINYIYDEFDRLKMIMKNNNIFNYKYDSNGNIAKVLSDIEEVKYKYDVANRVYECYLKNADSDNLKINYIYDSNNNIISRQYDFNDEKYVSNNVYDLHNQLTKTTNDSDETSYTYDSLGRLAKKEINNNIVCSYNYLTNGYRSTELVKEIILNNDKFTYEYDNMCNITKTYKNGNLIFNYQYDEFDELIRVDDILKNEYSTYAYNANGNMSSKTVRSLDSEELKENINYEYNNNWCDLLTRYNGYDIIYDEMGNPVSIGDNINLSWINGRILYNYKDSSNNLDVKYSYNDDNIRILKDINGNITKYFYDGDNIIFEKRGQDLIHYIYDQTGIIGFVYNNIKYYYLKNNQDDIIGILDSNYNIIVNYTYDSWGNVTSITDGDGNSIVDESNIGIINPFRYRGYYYDNETGLYYLQTRYYNPKWGRFMNADVAVGINEDFLSNNLFLYVSNNPINNCDEDGKKKKKKKKNKKVSNWIKIGVGLALGAAAVAAVVFTGGSVLPAIVGAAKIIGVSVAVTVGFTIASNVVDTIISGGNATDVKENMFNDVDDAVADGFLIGGATALALTGGQAYLQKVANEGISFFNKSIQIGYNTPSNPGGTIISIDRLNRFHLDLDSINGLHWHMGKTKSIRKKHHIIIEWLFGPKN